MGCKECLGRYGLMVTAVCFTLGVIVSTSSPSWISTSVENPVTGGSLVIEFGPFYSRNKTCSSLTSTTTTSSEPDCTDWSQAGIDTDDCNNFGVTDATVLEKLCTQHNAWRVIAEFCLFIVVGTGILVIVAMCTQCITCGCCGGTFDQLAMIFYWIEVILSIAAWSLCISVVSMLRGEDIQTILLGEFENVQQLENVEGIVDGNFLWGFWLFLFSGTVMGALCAIFADWAAEGSLLSCLFSCISSTCACIFCCKK
ncbi:expressed unknown protein [Seminavis robusta]|uniref:Uncharacterized protein n=1 Tax=Seminavis robusta TaxID=568900 RepID=A0A9N8HN19_9STRA|nr:expressed unknown protein [Seminavis robusta]|eukprot:Sro949_g223680.1 n/a (255) ;mRNA; f:24826-25590